MGGTSSTVTKSQGADEASSTNELGAWDGDATQREQRSGRHDEPRCGQFLLILDDPTFGDIERYLCSQIALVDVGYGGTRASESAKERCC